MKTGVARPLRLRAAFLSVFGAGYGVFAFTFSG
jgi:hypothetical protein